MHYATVPRCVHNMHNASLVPRCVHIRSRRHLVPSFPPSCPPLREAGKEFLKGEYSLPLLSKNANSWKGRLDIPLTSLEHNERECNSPFFSLGGNPMDPSYTLQQPPSPHANKYMQPPSTPSLTNKFSAWVEVIGAWLLGQTNTTEMCQFHSMN